MQYIANPVVVTAQVITDIEQNDRGGVTVVLDSGQNYVCDVGMVARYKPAVGDYLVTQSDGYVYLNPKDVFERKYRPSVAGNTDNAIEQEIQAKNKTAPRVTPADIEANIASEHYFNAGDAASMPSAFNIGDPLPPGRPGLDLLTFCILRLNNGFTVTGESACASPENFDPDIGRKIARANAVQKIWPLMGYGLRSRLAGGNA